MSQDQASMDTCLHGLFVRLWEYNTPSDICRVFWKERK